MVQDGAEPEDFAAQAARAAEAAQRADWPEALRRWEAIRAKFPEAPAGYLGVGVALRESDRADEAEDLLTAAVARFPRHCGLAAAHASVANRRRDWPEALRRWDEILARFADETDPHWYAARAEALLELGRPDEAEAIFRPLQSDPAFFRAEIGLARVAMARRNWEDALARWDRVLARFSSATRPHWRLGRAVTLLGLDRRDEAEAGLRGLLQTKSDFLPARLVLIASLASRGALEEALGEIGSEVSPSLTVRKIDILIRLQRLGDAIPEFGPALARAQQPIEFESMMLLIPRLFDGCERRDAWDSFQSTVRGAADADPRRAAALLPFALRALLALRDYQGFMRGIDRGEESGAVGGHRELLLSVASTLREADFPARHKPKIFGIGLSKTGTTSLAQALSILGLTTLHFLNPLTGELMSDDDLYLFDALTDTPVCLSFERFYSLFPNSKFIYTTRPIRAWEESFGRHLQRVWGTSDFDKMKSMIGRHCPFHHGRQFSEIHQSLYFDHENYEAAYRAYDRRVRAFFRDKPKTRFLEFSVFERDGWDELCAFLGRPGPSRPFPWENKAAPPTQTG